MNKEIMFVTGSMGRGGAERVISILSNYYVDKGFNVSILMLLHSNTSGYELNPKVKILDISNESRKAVIDMPRLILCTRKLISRRKPDAVVCFMAQNILITGLACLGLNQKLIVSERSDPTSLNRNPIYKFLLNWIYATCTKTIFQTKRARNYFPQKVQKNSVIIPNPIKVTCVAKGEKKNRIVTAGRLTNQKNHRLLIKAFSDVLKKYPDFELNIYGEGPKRGEIECLIKELGLDKKVKLMGSSAHLHSDIADALMFVLSSDYEGLSNALLESLMMGLSTISTDCAGSDEVIKDGYNGILVPVGNQEELKKAIVRLIEDKELANTISSNGRKDALEKYTLEHVIAKWNKEIQ